MPDTTAELREKEKVLQGTSGYRHFLTKCHWHNFPATLKHIIEDIETLNIRTTVVLF